MNPNIEISDRDLNQTIDVCAQELDNVLKSRESKLEILWNVFQNEFRFFLIFSGLGCLLLGSSVLWAYDQRFLLYGTFFCLFGALGLYEILNEKIYHVEELIHVCRINGAQLFLYKNLICSLLETLFFLILLYIESTMYHKYTSLILATIIPLLVGQVLSLQLEKKCSNPFVVLGSYLVFFTFYEIVFQQFHLWIIKHVSVEQILVFSAIVSFAYVLNLLNLYQREKRKEILSWN